jgi:hypothetical protein
VHGCNITFDCFSQQHISALRRGLYVSLSAKPKSYPDFFCSFFPNLVCKVTTGNLVIDNFEVDTTGNFVVDQPDADHTLVATTAKATMSPIDKEKDDGVFSGMDTIFAPLFFLEKDDTELGSDTETSTNVEDLSQQQVKQFDSLVDIDELIDKYESKSGFRLIITRSNERSRTYVCRSHVNCCFRVRFGRKRGTDKIVHTSNRSHHINGEVQVGTTTHVFHQGMEL